MNQLRFISRVLYRLKRRYGSPVNLMRRTSSTVDVETGVKTVTVESKQVSRAIVLPAIIQREFYYDLAFIASNKNFTMGGHVDNTERKVIFDRADLADWIIETGMYFVYDGVRYDVKTVQEFEERRGYLIVGKASLAEPNEELIEVSLVSDVDITDEGENTP